MSQYYLADGSNRRGPFTPEQLVSQGLTAETLVWREGMPDWARADALPELRAYIPAFRPAVAPTPQAPYPQAPYPQTPYPQQPYPQQPYAPQPGFPPQGAGYVNYQTPQMTGQSYQGYAIAGFVLSFFCGLLGLIFSAIALSGMSKSGNPKGKGLAIAGLVISIAAFVFNAIWVIGNH